MTTRALLSWQMRATWFLIAAIGGSVAACGDQCHDGEWHCDGNDLIECTTRNDNTFAFRDDGSCSPALCVEAESDGEPVAACSTTGAPDPQCNQPHDTLGYYACADPSTLVYCVYGYSRFAETCDSGACVESTTGGTCP